MEKQTAIIIPARYGSSRLEGKPLLSAGGKYIIQWVWEKASKCANIDRVIIATDDERIFSACIEFGSEVEMTSNMHKSGSDRIAEVAARHPEIEYIINLQGDEPLIDEENIELVRKGIVEDKASDISTLIREIKDSLIILQCIFLAQKFLMKEIKIKVNSTGILEYMVINVKLCLK